MLKLLLLPVNDNKLEVLSILDTIVDDKETISKYTSLDIKFVTKIFTLNRN